MTLRDLQVWLCHHGQSIAVDGKPGPQTRAAIIAAFANKEAPAITQQEMATIAARLGGSTKQLAAVSKVESGGGGFLPTGHPKILWERHYFWKRIQIKIPLISDPTPGGYTVDADGDGINDSWEKLADAAMRSPIAAFESCSWGKFQVMGAHAKKLGYPNALEMAWSLTRSEAAHYELLARYIEAFGLKPAFQKLSPSPMNCIPFARGYNGPGFRKFRYHEKLAQGMV